MRRSSVARLLGAPHEFCKVWLQNMFALAFSFILLNVWRTPGLSHLPGDSELFCSREFSADEVLAAGNC